MKGKVTADGYLSKWSNTLIFISNEGTKTLVNLFQPEVAFPSNAFLYKVPKSLPLSVPAKIQVLKFCIAFLHTFSFFNPFFTCLYYQGISNLFQFLSLKYLQDIYIEQVFEAPNLKKWHLLQFTPQQHLLLQQ